VDFPWQWQVALGALALALLASAVTDLRNRRILNAVTFPALVIELSMFFWLGGVPLLTEACIGGLVCTLPLFVAMLKGWMGAGDVKLMALCGVVAGAWAGWGFSLVVLAYVSVAGGIEALVFIVAARLRGLERPKYVPYGLAIAAGAAAAFVFGAPGG